MTPVARALSVVRARGVSVRCKRPPRALSWERQDGAPWHSAAIESDPTGKPIRIWWYEEDTDARAACGLIHEAAHVLLGVEPSEADELDSPMLAWELEMQKEAGVLAARARWMKDFGCGKVGRWGDLTFAEKCRVIQWSKWRATEKRSGEP